jgi:hypothetical protein
VSKLFGFEQDFTQSLRCIPMIVRFKLDRCGIKLKLSHWQSITFEQKLSLVDFNCDTETELQAYRSLVLAVCANQFTPQDLPISNLPEWLEIEQIPEPVLQKAKQIEIEISLKDWQQLLPLQRFALIKLSRSNHENHNFLPALQEFGLNGEGGI